MSYLTYTLKVHILLTRTYSPILPYIYRYITNISVQGLLTPEAVQVRER